MHRTMVQRLVTKGKLAGPQREDVDWQVDRFEEKHNKLIAHLIRGSWEINHKNKVFRDLPVGHVIEVQDWKMKFIMLLFREVRHNMCSRPYYIMCMVKMTVTPTCFCRLCQISLGSLVTRG